MFLLFDIGGTKTRVSSSANGKTLGEILVQKTQKEWKDETHLLKELFGKASAGRPVESVAGGMPGVFDEKHEKLLRSPNLRNWENSNVKEDIKALSGSDVLIMNDTVMAGLGEATFGAGKGYEIVAYITVSTGVGGVKIERGKFDDARTGSEPGQQIIDRRDLSSLESLVSGSSFEKRFGSDFLETAPKEAWLEAAHDLAVGVHNTIVHWSPDIVILGGSMMTKPPVIPLEAVRKELKDMMKIFPVLPKITLASLKDSAGLFGALAYLAGKR